jgi:hypothetical protein
VAALLLDGHIATAVAVRLRQRWVDVLALAEWHDGAHLDASDDELLRLVRAERRVFATFDVRTVPPLLRVLGDAAVRHGGVVLVSPGAFRQDDVGGLVRALERVARVELPGDATDVVIYLRR